MLESLWPVILVIASIGLMAWATLHLFRRLKRSAEVAQQRAFEGLEVRDHPSPGAVSVVFHTYYGFIFFVVQDEHRFWANPEDARLALWRLHRFNLAWGMFAYGAILVPLLSYGNYLAQKASIRNQIQRAA